MKFFSVGLFVLIVFDSLQGSTIPNKRSERALNATLQTHFNGSYLRRNPCNDSEIERSSYSATHEFNHHTKETDWGDYARQCAVLISNFLRAISNLVSSKCDHEGTYHFNINTTVTQTGGSTCNTTGKQWNCTTPTIHISSTDCNKNGPECACIQDGGNGMKNFQLRGKQYNCVLVSDGSSQASSNVNKDLGTGQSEQEPSTAQCDLENKETTSQSNQKTSEEVIVNQPIQNAQQSTGNEFAETSSLPLASVPVIQNEADSTPQSVNDKAIPQVPYQSDANSANLPVAYASSDKIIAPPTTQSETSGPADTKISPQINNIPLSNIQTEPVLTQTSPSLDNSLPSQSIFTTFTSNYDQGVTYQPLSPLENTSDFNRALPNFEEKSYITTISPNPESSFNPEFPVSLPAEKLSSNLLSNYSPEAQFQEPIAQPPATKTTTNYIEEVTTTTFRPPTSVNAPTYFDSAQLSNSEPPSDSQIGNPEPLPFNTYTTPAPVFGLNQQAVLSQTQSDVDQTLPPAYSSYFEPRVTPVTNTPLPQGVSIVLPNQEPVTGYETTVRPPTESQTEEPCEDENSKPPLQPTIEHNIPSDAATAMSNSYPSLASPNYQDQDKIQTNFNIPTTYTPVLEQDSLIPSFTETSIPKDSDTYAPGLQVNPNEVNRDQFQSQTTVQSVPSTTTYSPPPQTDLVAVIPEEDESKQKLTNQNQSPLQVSYDTSEPITYSPVRQTDYIVTLGPAPQPDSLVASYPEHRQPSEYSSTSAPVTQSDHSENCEEESSDQSSSQNQKPTLSVPSSQTGSLGGDYLEQSLPAQYVPTYPPDEQPTRDVIYADQIATQNFQSTFPPSQQNSFVPSYSEQNIPNQFFTSTPTDQALDQTQPQNIYESAPQQNLVVSTYPEQNRPGEYFSTTAPTPQSDKNENCEDESSDQGSFQNQKLTTSAPSYQSGTFASDYPQQSLSDQYVQTYAPNQQQPNDVIYQDQLPNQNVHTTFSPPQQSSLVLSYPEQNIPDRFFTNAPTNQALDQTQPQSAYDSAPQQDLLVTTYPEQNRPGEYFSTTAPIPQSDNNENREDESSDQSPSENQKLTTSAPSYQSGTFASDYLQQSPSDQYVQTYAPNQQQPNDAIYQDQLPIQNVQTTFSPPQQSSLVLSYPEQNIPDQFFTNAPTNQALDQTQPQSAYDSAPQQDLLVTTYPEQNRPGEYFSTTAPIPQSDNNENREDESSNQSSSENQKLTTSAPSSQSGTFASDYLQQSLSDQYVQTYAPNQQQPNDAIYQDQLPIQNVQTTFSPPQQSSLVPSYLEQNIPDQFFTNAPNTQSDSNVIIQDVEQTTYGPAPEQDFSVTLNPDQTFVSQNPIRDSSQIQGDENCDEESQKQTSFQIPEGIAPQTELPVISDPKKNQPNQYSPIYEPEPQLNRAPSQEQISFQDPAPTTYVPASHSSQTFSSYEYETTHAPITQMGPANENQLPAASQPKTVVFESRPQEGTFVTPSPQQIETSPISEPVIENNDESKVQTSQLTLPSTFSPVAQPDFYMSPHTNQFRQTDIVSTNAPDTQFKGDMIPQDQIPAQTLPQSSVPTTFVEDISEQTQPSKYFPTYAPEYIPNSDVSYQGQLAGQFLPQSPVPTTYEPVPQTESFLNSYSEQYPTTYGSDNQPQADLSYDNQSPAVNTPSTSDSQVPVLEPLPVDTYKPNSMASADEPLPDAPVFNNAEPQPQFQPTFAPPLGSQFSNTNQYPTTFPPRSQTVENVTYVEEIITTTYSPQTSVTPPTYSYSNQLSNFNAPSSDSQVLDSLPPQQSQSNTAPVSKSNSISNSEQIPSHLPFSEPKNQSEINLANEEQLPEGTDSISLQREPLENTFQDPRLRNRYVSTVAPETRQSSSQSTAFTTYGPTAQPNPFVASYPEQYLPSPKPPIYVSENQPNTDVIYQNQFPGQTSSQGVVSSINEPSEPDQDSFEPNLQDPRLRNQFSSTLAPENQLNNGVIYQDQSPDQIEPQSSVTQKDSFVISFPENSFLYPTTYSPEPKTQNDDSCNECQEQSSPQNSAPTYAPESQNSFVTMYPEQYSPTFAPQSQSNSGVVDQNQLLEQPQLQDDTYSLLPQQDSFMTSIPEQSVLNSYRNIHSKGQSNDSCDECQKQTSTESPSPTTYAPASVSNLPVTINPEQIQPSQYPSTFPSQSQTTSDVSYQSQSPDQISDIQQISFPQQGFQNLNPTTYEPEVQSQKDDSCHECQEQTSSQSPASTAYTSAPQQDSFVTSFSKPFLLSSDPTTYAPETRTQSDDSCNECQGQTSTQGPEPTIYPKIQSNTRVSTANSLTTISSESNGYAFETQEESPNQVASSITLAPASQPQFEKPYSQDYAPNFYSPTLAPSTQFNNDATVTYQSSDQTSSLEMAPATYIPIQSTTYSDKLHTNQFSPTLESDSLQNQNNAQTLSQGEVSQSDSLLIQPEQTPTYAPEYKPNSDVSYQGQMQDQFSPQSPVPTTYRPVPQTESFLNSYSEQYPTTYGPDNQPQAGLSYDNQSPTVNTPSTFDSQVPGALEPLPVDTYKPNSMISAGEPLPDAPVFNNAELQPQFQPTFAPSPNFQFSNANQYPTTFPPRPQTFENVTYVEEVITTTYSPQTSVTPPTYSYSNQLSNFNAPSSDSQVIDTVPPPQPFDSFTTSTTDDVNQKPAFISQPEPDYYVGQSSQSDKTFPITYLPYVQDDVLSDQYVPQSEKTTESQNENSQTISLTPNRNNYKPLPSLSPKSEDIHTNFEQPQFTEALGYGPGTTETNINDPTDAFTVMTENPLTVTQVPQSQLDLSDSNQLPNSNVAESPDAYYPVDPTYIVPNTVQTTNSESQPPQDNSNSLPDFKSQHSEFQTTTAPQDYSSSALPIAKNDASDAQGFPNYNQGFSTFTPQTVREEFIKDVITTTASPLGGYGIQSSYPQQSSVNYYSPSQATPQPQYNEQIPIHSFEPTNAPTESTGKSLGQLPDNNFHQEPLNPADNGQATTYGSYFESFTPKNDQKLFYGTTFVPDVQGITGSESTGDTLASNSESLSSQFNYNSSPLDVKQLSDSRLKLTEVPAQSQSFETSTFEPKLQNNDFIPYENQNVGNENLNTYAPAFPNPTSPVFQGSEMNENQQPDSNAPQRQEPTIVYQDQISNFNSKPQADSLVTAPTPNLPVTEVRPQDFPQSQTKSNLEPTNFNTNESKQLESTTVPFHQFFSDMYSTFPSNMKTDNYQMPPNPTSDNNKSVLAYEPVQDFLSNIITTIAPQSASDFDEDEDQNADKEVNKGSLSPDSGVFSDSQSPPNSPVENSAIIESQPLFHETSVPQENNAELSSSSGTTFAPDMQSQNKFLDSTGATPQQQQSIEFSDKLANFNVRPKSEPTGEPSGTAMSSNSFGSYNQELSGSPQQENVVQYKEDTITTGPLPGSSYDGSFMPEYLSRGSPRGQIGQNLEHSEQNELPPDTFLGITDRPNTQDQYQKAASTYAPQQMKVFEFEEDIITTTAPSYRGLSTQSPLPLPSYPQENLANNYATESHQYQSSTDPKLETTRPNFDGNTPFPLAPQLAIGPTSAPGNVEVFKYEKDIITTIAPFKASSDFTSQNPQPYGYSNQTSSPASPFLGFGSTSPQPVEVVKFEEDIYTYPATSSLSPQPQINSYTTTIAPSGQSAGASPSIQQTFDSMRTTPFPDFPPTSNPQFNVVKYEEDIITTTAPVGYGPPTYPQTPMNSYATTTAPSVQANDSPSNQQPSGSMEATSSPNLSPASNPQLVKEVQFEEDIITTTAPAGSRALGDSQAPINSYATTVASIGQSGAFPSNQQIFDSFGTTAFPNFPPTSNPQFNVVKFEKDIITTTAPAGYRPPTYPQAPMNSYASTRAPTTQSDASPSNQQPFGSMEATSFPNLSPASNPQLVKEVQFEEDIITTTAPAGSRALGDSQAPINSYATTVAPIGQSGAYPSNQQIFDSFGTTPFPNSPPTSNPQQVKVVKFEEDIITTTAPAGYRPLTYPQAQSDASSQNPQTFGFMGTTPFPNFPTNPGSQVKVVEITEETITTTAPRATGPASQLPPFSAYSQIPSSTVQPNFEMSDQLSNFNSRQPEPSVNAPQQNSNENIYQTPYGNSQPQQVKIFEYEEDIITTRGPPTAQSLSESSQQPQNVYETTFGPPIQSVLATQPDQLTSYSAQKPQMTTTRPQAWGYDQTPSAHAPQPTTNLYQFEENIVTTTAPYGLPSRSNQNSEPLEAPQPQLLDSTPSSTSQPDLSSANAFSNSASSVATSQPTNDALSTFGPVPDSTFSGLDHRRLPFTESGFQPFSTTFAPAGQQPFSAPDDSFFYQPQSVGNTPYSPGLNYRDPVNVNPQEINPNAGVSAAQDYTSTQQPDSYALVPDQTTPSNLPGENNVFTCAQGTAEPPQAVLPCPFSPEMIGNMTAPSYYILVSKLSNDSGSPCSDKEERFKVEKVYLGDGTPLNCSLSQTRTFPASLYKPVQFSGAATVKLPTSCDNA